MSWYLQNILPIHLQLDNIVSNVTVQDAISPTVFSGVCATRSLIVYVCFVDLCFLLSFLLLSVLLRVTDSDYPFGILKLFPPYFYKINIFKILIWEQVIYKQLSQWGSPIPFPTGGVCVLSVIRFQDGGRRSAVISAEARK